MVAAFCLDLAWETNAVYSDKHFAEWADHVCIYGLESELNIPQAVYTVLVYSKNAPQIVTALYRMDEDSYITKTSFVYNTVGEPDSIYAAFPVVAEWELGTLNSQVINMKEQE